MKEIVIVDGVTKFIYSDEVATALKHHGDLSIRRASHVEPTEDGRWTADMSPVHGPVLGPFETRAEALAAETEWLSERLPSL